MAIHLFPLDAGGIDWAQDLVRREHYLRKGVDRRCLPEAYGVRLRGATVGVLILGRPQATRCEGWYGSLADIATGWAEVTRWQVLNLARVFLRPLVQPGGTWHTPEILPGFTDRRGVFRSTLASEVLRMVAERVPADYLVRRPPCFLEEPYELRWLLSYCDTRIHRGTIYRAAGWELYRTNADGVQTWRTPLRALTPAEDRAVRAAAAVHPRSRAMRGRRAQTTLTLVEVR